MAHKWHHSCAITHTEMDGDIFFHTSYIYLHPANCIMFQIVYQFARFGDQSANEGNNRTLSIHKEAGVFTASPSEPSCFYTI